ncbi:MAG: TRAP transporter substrate-binding protein [Deltaproteobacteria bacterium]|nr:TRAP transporter substrate-binding protein [Deltaproteobacteria bacterium]
MKKGKLIVVGLVMTIGLMIGWAPASSGQTITLKLGSIDAVANPANVATLKFAELVGQKTNGKVKIEVYPASQLGNAISQIESIMTGSLDMGQFAVGFFGQYIKDWNILALAFAFKDHDHLKKFLASDTNAQIKDQFLKQYKVRVLVENFLRPPNVISTTKPVRKLDDLKDLKMRVPEIEMYLQNWKQLGTKPTVVAWGETYMGLRQGVVEGVDMPFDFIKGMKFYEVAPHITMTNHLLTHSLVIIGESVYQKLPEEAKKALVDAGREAGDYYGQLWKKGVEADREDLLKTLNAKIYEVDVTPFRERMAPLAKELEGKGYWRNGLYSLVQTLAK